jgi:hypothetical protein
MPYRNLKYHEPEPISKEKVLSVIKSGVIEEVQRTLVDMVFFEEDFDFALNVVLGCASSASPEIRGTAILCLGHLARIHRAMPESPVVEIIRQGLLDPNPYVRSHSDSAADDITSFVPQVGCLIRGSSKRF